MEKIKQQLDALAITALMLLIAAVFYKTIFLGVSISRAAMLIDSDSLFSALATGGNQTFDLTISRLHVPNYFMISRQLQGGYLPLWNPLSGLGCPIIGDIQSLVLSPLQFLLSPWTSLYAYNLMMILYLVLGATGAYLLARTLALNSPAAIFVSTAYIFCPFNLFWLEPMGGPSECLYPIVFWLFVRLAYKASRQRCAAAATGCAVLILSGHVQYSLWGLAFGSALTAFIMLTTNRVSAAKNTDEAAKNSSLAATKNLNCSGTGKATKVIGVITLTMLITFLLSAPVLLPFVEYLKNSDCYKTGISAGSYLVPWQAVAFMLLHPCFGAGSPYLGSLIILLLPLAFFVRGIKRRILGPILWLDLLAVIVMIQPKPLAALFSISPLSWLQPRYCIPIITLCTSVIAGFGLEQCAFKLRWGLNRKTCVFMLWATAIILIPLTLRAAHFNTVDIHLDPYLPAMSIDYRSSIRDLFLIGITIAALILKTKNKSINATIVSAVLICCNLGSELSVSRTSLPPQISFSYPPADPVPYLQAKGERILSFGRHVFRPNSNFVFGIQNLNSTNVLWPHHLLNFVSESGGWLMGLGVYQIFEDRLSKLVDLASVKYVVSQIPVLAIDDPEPPLKTPADNCAEHNEEIYLSKVSCLYDPVNHDAFGKMIWLIKDSAAQYFNYQIAVTDCAGKLLWSGDNREFGDNKPLNHGGGGSGSSGGGSSGGSSTIEKAGAEPISAHTYVENLLAIIPTDADCSNGLKIVVRLTDLRVRTVSEFTLYKLRRQNSQNFGQGPMLPRHFKLVSERKADHIRVYENMHALPQVYAVHNVRNAKSSQQALKLIEDSGFNPQREVIIEEQPGTVSAFSGHSGLITLNNKIDAPALETITWKRPDFNHVEISADLRHGGLIVLTDCYYPGWQAYIDGKPTKILRADYLFRAICVPPGYHHVSFSYNPLSFRIGVRLALVGLLFLLAAVFFQKTHHKLKTQDPE